MKPVRQRRSAGVVLTDLYVRALAATARAATPQNLKRAATAAFLAPLFVLAFVLVLKNQGGAGGSYTTAPDSMLNSNEPGCDGSDATVLVCEDFERKNNGTFPGDWYGLSGDSAVILGGVSLHTKGWHGGHEDEPHPIIHGGAVDCSDTLVVGFGTCTAHMGQFPLSEAGVPDVNEGDITNAQHSFPNQLEHQELYYREYFWHSVGFVYSSTKYLTFNRCCNGGGVYWGGVGINSALNDTSSVQSNFRLSNNLCDSAPSNCGGASTQYYEQNLNLPRDSLVNYQGQWGYLEVRVKLNTVAGVNDGIYEMWMDLCGPTLPGTCTGTETKVLSHTNIPFGKIAGTGGSLGMGGQGTHWVEFWSNPQVGGRSPGSPDYGTWRRDNIVIATRFIGHYVPN